MKRGRPARAWPLLFCLLLLAGVARASPYPLANVLSAEHAERLAKQKIETTTELLRVAATGKARKGLARATGIKLALILGWVQMSDLLRIKGVGSQMVKLLNGADVSTIAQLKKQKAKALARRVAEANQRLKITETPPTAEQLKNWIWQAGKLKVLLKP